jgi:hypothetical protein
MWPFERLTPTGHALRRARRLIERKGWAQGSHNGVRGPGPCAAQAIVLAARKEPVNFEVVLAAFATHNDLPYRRAGYSPTQRTTTWNDTLGRTKDEVLAAFEVAEAAETVRPRLLRLW